MKKPTIAEIKVATLAERPHFFTRETLRFFGQTMRDFRVLKAPQSGRVFIAAPMRVPNRTTGKYDTIGTTFREFTGTDLEIVTLPDGKIADFPTPHFAAIWVSTL